MTRVYQKLVRDRIPDMIRAQGETPVTRVLDEAAYRAELERKLTEECREALAASDRERLEELADVMEVILHLAALEGAGLPEVIALAQEKRAQRGGFADRIFLERVETP